MSLARARDRTAACGPAPFYLDWRNSGQGCGAAPIPGARAEPRAHEWPMFGTN